MSFQWIMVIIFAVAFIGILTLTEFLYRHFSVSPEYTRKTGHVLASLSSILFVFVFDSYIYVLALGIIFFIVLFLGKTYHLFLSINDVKRKSIGSFLLPISIALMFYISYYLNEPQLFVLPVLILGISDPLAGIFGITFAHKTRNIKLFKFEFDKTILGSIIFFVSAFVISLACLFPLHDIAKTMFLSLLIAFLTTFVEIVSTRGMDNITVPVSAMLILTMV